MQLAGAGLSKWELLVLFMIGFGIFFLSRDQIRKVSRKRRRKKMLRSYLCLKNEKWDELVGVLADQRNLGIAEIQSRIQLDFSVFNQKYKDLIYHEVVKINEENDLNPWNFRELTRKLIH